MLGITQILSQQLTQYRSSIEQEYLEQETRAAMQHLLDQIHLKPFKYYSYSSGLYYSQSTATAPLQGPGSGIYYFDVNNDPSNQGTGELLCLINLNPSRDGDDLPILSPGTILYYDNETNTLNYGDDASQAYLVADKITSITLTPGEDSGDVDIHFIKIEIKAENSANQSFELVTWQRLL